jgi:pimeloyl-ACP methyl ester carboxylesterase
VLDVLALLIRERRRVVPKEEILDTVWGSRFVSESTLTSRIKAARRAIGDDGTRQELIRTVHGRGYQFVGTVEELGDAPAPAAEAAAAAPPPQQIRFCTARDGTRLAYATLGEGPPLVKAANWLSHLELDWRFDVWRHWLPLFSRRHTLVRYDARGNGLSDWAPPELSFERFVSDLASVFDAAGVDRAPVVGLSQGASVAVTYAARHPERVSALILIGGCARGWRAKNHPSLARKFEAMMVLMRDGWGRQNPAFRQIFTTTFFPDADQKITDDFNELQRVTTSPQNAAALLSALGDIDVRDDLPRVKVPTLVLHGRDDAVVPMKDGVELASGIAGARFVPLESRNHVVLPTEPAWARFSSEIETFLAQEALS